MVSAMMGGLREHNLVRVHLKAWWELFEEKMEDVMNSTKKKVLMSNEPPIKTTTSFGIY